MALEFDFQTNIAETLKKLNTLSDAQLPGIVAHAMNKTMATVRAKEKQRIRDVFSAPTPYAINAPYTVPAKPATLETSIALRRFGGKGVPAERFLGPEIAGGARSYKAHEKALAAAGILPPGMFCVPASHAGTNGYLNQYGNMPGSLINRILVDLRANRDATQNRKARKAKFFAVSSKTTNNLPLGIYERVGNGVRMVIAFVKPPSYHKRFDYFETAQSIVDRFFISDLKTIADEAVHEGRVKTFDQFAAALEAIS